MGRRNGFLADRYKWQVRTGKVMCYNAETGHRVKEPKAFVSWAHSELKLLDFHLKQ